MYRGQGITIPPDFFHRAERMAVKSHGTGPLVRVFSPDEDRYILANYRTMGKRHMCAHLGVGKDLLRKRYYFLTERQGIEAEGQ